MFQEYQASSITMELDSIYGNHNSVSGIINSNDINNNNDDDDDILNDNSSHHSDYNPLIEEINEQEFNDNNNIRKKRNHNNINGNSIDTISSDIKNDEDIDDDDDMDNVNQNGHQQPKPGETGWKTSLIPADVDEDEKIKIVCSHLIKLDHNNYINLLELDYDQKEELQNGIQGLNEHNFEPLMKMLQKFLDDEVCFCMIYYYLVLCKDMG